MTQRSKKVRVLIDNYYLPDLGLPHDIKYRVYVVTLNNQFMSSFWALWAIIISPMIIYLLSAKLSWNWPGEAIFHSYPQISGTHHGEILTNANQISTLQIAYLLGKWAISRHFQLKTAFPKRNILGEKSSFYLLIDYLIHCIHWISINNDHLIC